MVLATFEKALGEERFENPSVDDLREVIGAVLAEHPATDVRCTYAVQWVAVKYRWSLTVDTSEKAALTSLLSESCGSTSISVAKATLASHPAQRPSWVALAVRRCSSARRHSAMGS